MAFGSSSPNFIYPRPASGLSDERLTVSTAVVQFSSIATWGENGLCRMVLFDIQTEDVMVTLDGSTPSATNGHQLYAGQNYTWSYDTIKAARFIRQGSADAVIHASPLTF